MIGVQTPRDQEVAVLVAQGLTNRQISERSPSRSSPSIPTTPSGTSDDTDRGIPPELLPASSHSSEPAGQAPRQPRDDRELQSPVVLGQDAGPAEVREGFAHFGIEGRDGRFAHMRSRESAL